MSRDIRSFGHREPVGEAVGLLAERAAECDRRLTDLEGVADLHAEAIEQSGLGQDNAGLSPRGAGILRLEHRDFAIERVGGIDRLDFDERAFAVFGAGHGAEARQLADLAELVQRGQFLGTGLAMDHLEGEVAADQQATLIGERLVEGGGQRTDGGHSSDAEVEYLHPEAIETEPTLPHEIGMHRVAFSVDDIDAALKIAARHGCHPLRGVATYQDV